MSLATIINTLERNIWINLDWVILIRHFSWEGLWGLNLLMIIKGLILSQTHTQRLDLWKGYPQFYKGNKLKLNKRVLRSKKSSLKNERKLENLQQTSIISFNLDLKSPEMENSKMKVAQIREKYKHMTCQPWYKPKFASINHIKNSSYTNDIFKRNLEKMIKLRQNQSKIWGDSQYGKVRNL